jgi:hypothetical protein
MVAIDEAVASIGPGETRIALLAEGRVVEFIIDRGAPAPGDVIEGRVIEISPALNAAFVDIGEPLPAYLAKPGSLGVGASARVEIVVTARPGKGAEAKLAGADMRPLRRSPLARALAAHPAIARVAVDDRAALADARRLFSAAEYAAHCFAETGAADALEEALAQRVVLPEGASLDFAETAAVTAIDVDGGGLAPMAANAAAIPTIARHLRLRGIGGHILIDIIPTKDRRKLMGLVEALRAAVADDPAPAQVAGHTPLGMLELTRRRLGPSLADIMLVPAARGLNPLTMALDGLRALLREADARPAARLALALPPAALSALRARPAAIEDAERRLSRPLALIERRDIETFAIEDQLR